MPRLVEGTPAAVALTAAIDRVTGLLPHLTAGVGAGVGVASPGPVPADGVWIASAALIDDPPWLGRIIRATGAGIGTDDPVVAASAFVQSYSYRVLTLTVACLTASGVVPDASAASMAVGLARHWPSLVRFTGSTVTVMDDHRTMTTSPPDSDTVTDALRLVVHQAIDLHLHPLLDAVHTGLGVPVGGRLLWGNVAASAATAFRTMAGTLGRRLEPLGERFFALAPPELQGLGSFLVLDHAGHRGWFYERTTCCLCDRLPEKIRCADCSLTPPDDRRRAYARSLELRPLEEP